MQLYPWGSGKITEQRAERLQGPKAQDTYCYIVSSKNDRDDLKFQQYSFLNKNHIMTMSVAIFFSPKYSRNGANDTILLLLLHRSVCSCLLISLRQIPKSRMTYWKYCFQICSACCQRMYLPTCNRWGSNVLVNEHTLRKVQLVRRQGTSGGTLWGLKQRPHWVPRAMKVSE